MEQSTTPTPASVFVDKTLSKKAEKIMGSMNNKELTVLELLEIKQRAEYLITTYMCDVKLKQTTTTLVISGLPHDLSKSSNLFKSYGTVVRVSRFKNGDRKVIFDDIYPVALERLLKEGLYLPEHKSYTVTVKEI